MENAAVAPEIFCVRKKLPLMLRHGDLNAAFNGLVIALALVAMMVRVKNPVYLADSQVV
jgi:hypothetical protein